jgi:hypothetical protein
MGIELALTKMAPKTIQIQYLTLHDCNLKDEGFAAILKGLIKQDCLTTISFSKDELGAKSVQQINIL